MLNICIFDDDLQHVQIARNCVTDYAASVDLDCNIETFTKESELLACASEDRKIDLLFSDIELGRKDRSGVEVVKAFQVLQPLCRVVYLTNHLAFATEIYDTPHIYFVLKSELKQRLPHVFKKVMQFSTNKVDKQLCIKQKGGETVIPLDDIIYFEHHGRKTDIVTTRETFTMYQKMSELMEQLCARDFVWCHSSYIVHLKYVTKFHRTGFTMSNGQVVPISRNNYVDTKQRFSNYI